MSIEKRASDKIQVGLQTGVNWPHQSVQGLTSSETEMDCAAPERLQS